MAGSGIIGTLLLSIVTQANVSGLNRTDRAIMRTTKQVQRLRRETGLVGKFGKGLAGMLGIGYGVMGIKNAITGYVEFEKQLGAIHSRFYALENDSAKANKQFDFARKIAKDTAMDIKDVADSYSIFYSSAKRALGEGGAQEVYKNWTEVSRVLHLSGAQYERVMYALREMSSKGQLYAQDLMIQMGTHVPDIRDIAETSIRSLGIKDVQSIKDFQEFTKKGTPESKTAMARFLVEMSKETKRRYASDEALKKALQQPDALIQNIRNMGFEFMYKFSQAGGSYMIIKILQGLSDFVTGLDFEGITKSLGQIAHFIGDITRYMPLILNALKWIGLSFLASKIGGMAGGLAGGIGKGARFLSTAMMAKGQGKLFPWLLSKAGFGGLGGLITRIGAVGFKSVFKSMFSKGWLSGIIKLLVGFIPGLGQFIQIILWLPVIIDILRGIWGWIQKKWGDKKQTNISKHLVV